MQNTITSYKTRGNDELYCQQWLPDKTPQGHIVILHGLGAHSGSYPELVPILCDAGFAVYAPDLRNNGHNKGTWPMGVPQLVDDLEDYLEYLTKNGVTRPMLFGHSVGGLVATLFLMRPGHQDLVERCVLSAPYFEAVYTLGKRFLSWLSFDLLPRKLTMMNIEIPLPLPIKDLTQDQEILAQYRQDKLRIKRVRIAFLMDMNTHLEAVLKGAHRIDRVPMLVFHGEADPVCTCIRSQQFFDAITTPNKAIKIYRGYLHECLQAPPEMRRIVEQDILAFLQRKFT